MEFSQSQISLLYVDDEDVLLELTKRYLEQTGDYLITTASSAKEALGMIQDQKFDVIVSDYQMPEMDGLEFLRILRTQGNTIPFIIFTGKGREEVAIEALNAGADYYLQKGGRPRVQFGELQNCVRQLVEKSRAERQLLENDQQMADVINFLPDATFAIDSEGKVIAWNLAIEEMTGVNASEMIGKGDYEYAIPFYGNRRPILIDIALHDNLRKEVFYPVIHCINKGKCYAEIFLPNLLKGEGAHLWFKASLLYNLEGTVTGAIESIRDISDLKQAEDLYQAIFENSGTAMMVLDEDTTILSVNEKMTELLGYSKDELQQGLKNWHDLPIHEEDREKMLEYHRLRRIDPDSAPKDYEFRWTTKNREIKTAIVNVAMLPGTKKSIVSLINITERKEAEKKLKFTQFVVDNASEAILWIDHNGRFISVNKSAQKLFGYSEEELLNMYIHELDPNYPLKRYWELWDSTYESGSLIFESQVPRKDGVCLNIEVNLAILSFENKEYACCFIRDITERRKINGSQRD